MNRHIGECGWYKNGVWVPIGEIKSSWYHGTGIEKWMVGCKFQGNMCYARADEEPYSGAGVITFEDGRNDESISGIFNTSCHSPDRIQITRNQDGFGTWEGKCEYVHGNTRVDIMPYLESGEIKSCDVIECRDAIRRILSAGVKHKNSSCDVNVECDIVFML